MHIVERPNFVVDVHRRGGLLIRLEAPFADGGSGNIELVGEFGFFPPDGAERLESAGEGPDGPHFGEDAGCGKSVNGVFADVLLGAGFDVFEDAHGDAGGF